MSYNKYKAFTLPELAVALTILGILAVLVVPRAASFLVQARRGEAKANLAHIKSLQAIYKLEHSSISSGWTVGYNKTENCSETTGQLLNRLGFNPKGCEHLRYSYWVEGSTYYAWGPSDKDGKWIYPDCEGGTEIKCGGATAGDKLKTSDSEPIEVCRNIVKYCPGGGAGGNPPPSLSKTCASPPTTVSSTACPSGEIKKDNLASINLSDSANNDEYKVACCKAPPPPPPPPPPDPTCDSPPSEVSSRCTAFQAGKQYQAVSSQMNQTNYNTYCCATCENPSTTMSCTNGYTPKTVNNSNPFTSTDQGAYNTQCCQMTCDSLNALSTNTCETEDYQNKTPNSTILTDFRNFKTTCCCASGEHWNGASCCPDTSPKDDVCDTCVAPKSAGSPQSGCECPASQPMEDGSVKTGYACPDNTDTHIYSWDINETDCCKATEIPPDPPEEPTEPPPAEEPTTCDSYATENNFGSLIQKVLKCASMRPQKIFNSTSGSNPVDRAATEEQWKTACCSIMPPSCNGFSCPNHKKLVANPGSVTFLSETTCCECKASQPTGYTCPNNWESWDNTDDTDDCCSCTGTKRSFTRSGTQCCTNDGVPTNCPARDGGAWAVTGDKPKNATCKCRENCKSLDDSIDCSGNTTRKPNSDAFTAKEANFQTICCGEGDNCKSLDDRRGIDCSDGTTRIDDSDGFPATTSNFQNNCCKAATCLSFSTTNTGTKDALCGVGSSYKPNDTSTNPTTETDGLTLSANTLVQYKATCCKKDKCSDLDETKVIQDGNNNDVTVYRKEDTATLNTEYGDNENQCYCEAVTPKWNATGTPPACVATCESLYNDGNGRSCGDKIYEVSNKDNPATVSSFVNVCCVDSCVSLHDTISCADGTNFVGTDTEKETPGTFQTECCRPEEEKCRDIAGNEDSDGDSVFSDDLCTGNNGTDVYDSATNEEEATLITFSSICCKSSPRCRSAVKCHEEATSQEQGCRNASGTALYDSNSCYDNCNCGTGKTWQGGAGGGDPTKKCWCTGRLCSARVPTTAATCRPWHKKFKGSNNEPNCCVRKKCNEVEDETIRNNCPSDEQWGDGDNLVNPQRPQACCTPRPSTPQYTCLSPPNTLPTTLNCQSGYQVPDSKETYPVGANISLENYRDTCCEQATALCENFTASTCPMVPNTSQRREVKQKDSDGSDLEGNDVATCCCPADEPIWDSGTCKTTCKLYNNNQGDRNCATYGATINGQQKTKYGGAGGTNIDAIKIANNPTAFGTTCCSLPSTPLACASIPCSGRGANKFNKSLEGKPDSTSEVDFCCCPQLYDTYAVTTEGNPWECKTTCIYGKSQLGKTCSLNRRYNSANADTVLTETQMASTANPSPYDTNCCSDTCATHTTISCKENVYSLKKDSIFIPVDDRVRLDTIISTSGDFQSNCCKTATCWEWISYNRKTGTPNYFCSGTNIYDSNNANSEISGGYSFDRICCKKATCAEWKTQGTTNKTCDSNQQEKTGLGSITINNSFKADCCEDKPDYYYVGCFQGGICPTTWNSGPPTKQGYDCKFSSIKDNLGQFIRCASGMAECCQIPPP